LGPFTFVPAWVIQDALVLVATAATIVFIVRKEQHPEAFLMELFAFTLLYAAVYENFAALMGWYGYGRSILMVFNVPLTVPLVEYLVVYATLRMARAMGVPVWTQPLLAGFAGMVFDFSLDPLSVRQVFAGVSEPAIGRWSWFPPNGALTIFGIPVYNFSGWVLLCGYAAAALLVGRRLYERSGHRLWVGIVYPVAAMLAALLVMVSPLSAFLLWLGPLAAKGGPAEAVMLALYVLGGVVLMALGWRGRMRGAFTFRDNWPVFMVFTVFHVANIVFALVGGYVTILWVQLLAVAVQAEMVVAVWARGRGLVARSTP
jgi:hypothetical protein